jgi:hypothetical protein
MVVALIIYFIIQRSLRELLNEVIRLSSCTIFYMRILLIGLLLICLSGALDDKFPLSNNAAFMEYVWKAADGFSLVFGMTCFFITVYLLLITILVTVLRRNHDQ